MKYEILNTASTRDFANENIGKIYSKANGINRAGFILLNVGAETLIFRENKVQQVQ
ncbi:MAG: hypothetical protein ACRCVJ_18845 [Clostridium sp.]|uniref:hypothetical protein n=1 Tax=Clostridium sp. TaxID=1506 RepID=UPI003F2DC6B1